MQIDKSLFTRYANLWLFERKFKQDLKCNQNQELISSMKIRNYQVNKMELKSEFAMKKIQANKE